MYSQDQYAPVCSGGRRRARSPSHFPDPPALSKHALTNKGCIHIASYKQTQENADCISAPAGNRGYTYLSKLKSA